MLGLWAAGGGFIHRQPAFDSSEYYLDDDDDGMLASATNPGGFVLPEQQAHAVRVKEEDDAAAGGAGTTGISPAQFQQLHHSAPSTPQQPQAAPTSGLLHHQQQPTRPAVVAPAISQDQAKARVMIDQIQQLFATQDQHIEQIRQVQQQLVLQPQKDGVRQLQEQQWKLNQQIELELKELQGLHRSVILDPPALHQLRMLLQRLKIQQQKIELFRQELLLVLTPRLPSPWYATIHRSAFSLRQE